MAFNVVLKVGGQIAEAQPDGLLRVIRMLHDGGYRPVVVHGGGPGITRALAEKQINLPFVNGLRLTTEDAMAVVEQVLWGEMNPNIVQTLHRAGIPAKGVSGADGVISAEPVPGLDRTANVAEVHADQLVSLLDAGIVPVVAPIGLGPKGAKYNINADMAAAAVAGALRADRVVFLTDVDGIYENYATRRLVRQATPETLRNLRDKGCFSAGMLPKVAAILAALEAGSRLAFVVHGDNPDALLWAVRDNPVQQGMNWMIQGTCVSSGEEGIA